MYDNKVGHIFFTRTNTFVNVTLLLTLKKDI